MHAAQDTECAVSISTGYSVTWNYANITQQ